MVNFLYRPTQLVCQVANLAHILSVVGDEECCLRVIKDLSPNPKVNHGILFWKNRGKHSRCYWDTYTTQRTKNAHTKLKFILLVGMANCQCQSCYRADDFICIGGAYISLTANLLPKFPL